MVITSLIVLSLAFASGLVLGVLKGDKVKAALEALRK